MVREEVLRREGSGGWERCNQGDEKEKKKDKNKNDDKVAEWEEWEGGEE